MNRPDDELVEELKKGSEEAFSALYEKYAESVLRHLYCLLGNREESEDLLHECFMLLIEKINFYQPRSELKNSFKAWLYRLCTNRAIDELRKRKTPAAQELEAIVDEAPVQEELYEDREQEVLIHELLLKLPLIQRMVLGLRVHDDLSYLEISAICGRDINTVKQGLFQARKKMKDLLLAHGEII